MVFKRFDDNAKERLGYYLTGGDYVGSDFSYYAFLNWFEDLQYAEEDGAFYMRATMDGEKYYWPPLVNRDGALTRAQAASRLPKCARFAFSTEDFVSEMGENYNAVTHRDWSEYIYAAKDFIALEGKRFHAKRNHVKRFSALYSVEMRALEAGDEDAVKEFEKKWLDGHSFDGDLDDSAKRENEIVRGWYRAALKGETICDLLFANGNLVGVTIGEIMPSGNAVVMYEKADINYDGVYSYLANKFAERHFSGCQYINRQEDMGMEGLRKSKLSYCPEFLLNKYVLTPIGVKECCLPKSQTVPRNDIAPIEFASESSSALNGYGFLRLGKDDYDTLMTFYESGITKLNDKLFFLNYTPEELAEVLDNGFVMGAFFEGRLVSACAVDFDKEYGDGLKVKCGDTGDRQFYEFSGIMTDQEHRNKGLAHATCGRVIEYAKENLAPCTLCAVVQFDNLPSLNNLKKFGFSERAEVPQPPYLFKYLTLDL